MALEKKEYQFVLATLVEHAPMSSIANKLSKKLIETEDDTLKRLLRAVAAKINEALLDAPANKKSVKVCLANATRNDPYKSLAEYCDHCIKSTKPQWQIIAEQHGWGPK